ncbi:TetR/AcrR family transcriptional regulator [Actinophytocola sp.]|uniref:TetR/AcrR family transcriptional regulator n=1 Tax=Actinophytocola sp. TaxID=1872138 RepID=UPI003D6BBEB4
MIGRETPPPHRVRPPAEPQRIRRATGPLTDRGQARKAALLLAARRVFERKGFVDTRVADIVAEAKVAHGTFYTYFASKEAVFRAVAQDTVDDMLAALRAGGYPDDPQERVRVALRRFVEVYRLNARIIALTEQAGTFSPELRAMRLALREAFVRRSARSIRRLQKEGIADPGLNAVLTAEVLGAMVDQTCYVWFALARGFAPDAVLEALATTWARAIAVDGRHANRAPAREV